MCIYLKCSEKIHINYTNELKFKPTKINQFYGSVHIYKMPHKKCVLGKYGYNILCFENKNPNDFY